MPKTVGRVRRARLGRWDILARLTDTSLKSLQFVAIVLVTRNFEPF
jgi:hypothetical protein